MIGKLGRSLCDRRAITPVLTNLLLTVLAVAAMAIATTTTYVVSTNLRETMSERVIIEDLWFNPATRCISFYLRNTGKSTVDISSVYINHTSQPFPSPFNLEIGEHNWLNISYDWISNDLFYIDVVTTRGLHIGGYYSAP